MDGAQHSFDNYGLHQAAAAGDDDRVRVALESGADVNALDNCGRTVITCAVAGEKWETIDASDATFMSPSRLRLLSALVAHPDISLYTLNAPQSAMKGVTPLGMAAWLNMPAAVKVLLNDSAEAVSVDGMDTHGATALMYAARDGSLKVVQNLLRHGGRPDFRDVNHRTCIHYSLAHPRILWLCEAVLRRHRWRESQSPAKCRLFSDSGRLLELAANSISIANSFRPPPAIFFNHLETSTDTLIQAIQSSELSSLHSLLFSSSPPPTPSIAAPRPIAPPILVNRHDANGWSAIHHCVSAAHPSVDILDALYCAGSDVSIFTTKEHYTPLHCLARASPHPNADDASALYQFTVHLIRDLQAPLSARDKQHETCIHIAAEHGGSINVLIAFLDCDTTGSVRELRNSRGLTAAQIAQPQFLAAFGEDAEHLRPSSSLSIRTIRPVNSFGSMSSLQKVPPPRDVGQGNDSDSLVSTSDYDISASSHQLLSNLRLTSPALDHDPSPANVDYLESVLRDTVQIGHDIIRHFRIRIDDAVSELGEAKFMYKTVCIHRRVVKGIVDASLEEHRLDGALVRRGRTKRDSDDSQLTACEAKLNHIKSFSTPDLSAGRDPGNSRYKDASVSTEPLLDAQKASGNMLTGTRLSFGSGTLENFFPHRDDAVGSSIPILAKSTKQKGGCLRKEANLKLWMKSMAAEEGMPVMEKTKSGPAKFRAWLRKKMTPDAPFKLELVRDIDETDCNVGRDVKQDLPITVVAHDSRSPDELIHKFLRTSHVVLAAADRDLHAICQRTVVADQFIQAASQSVSKAEQIMKKALKKREDAIANLRSTQFLPLGMGGAEFSRCEDAVPPSPSEASTCSTRSSIVTLSAFQRKGDDEDTKALQRLLLRKVEARMVGAFEEIDKTVNWLQIAKEVIRGIKRRTYL